MLELAELAAADCPLSGQRGLFAVSTITALGGGNMDKVSFRISTKKTTNN